MMHTSNRTWTTGVVSVIALASMVAGAVAAPQSAPSAESEAPPVPTGVIRAEVVDAATAGPVPCRAWVEAGGERLYQPRSPGCVPYRKDESFSCGGSFEIEAPAGEVLVHVERGKEYRPVETRVNVVAGATTEVAIELRRWIHVAAEGWYSVDFHCHFGVGDVSVVKQQALADDVNVLPILSLWNQHQPDWPFPPDQAVVAADATHIVTRRNQEIERIGGDAFESLGAPLMHGLTRPVCIPDITERYPPDLVVLREAKGESPRSVIDCDKPIWAENAVGMAFGLFDAVQLCHNHYHRRDDIPVCCGMAGLLLDPSQREDWGEAELFWRTNAAYYRFLNCGFRLAATGGSAMGVMSVPLGYNRTYVRVAGPLTEANVLEAVRAGRTFATSGPMLLLTVDGRSVGETIALDSHGDRTLAVRAEVRSIQPIDKIEIVQNGDVIKSVDLSGRAVDGVLREVATCEISPKRSGWVAARAIFPGPGAVPRQAHTSPVYVIVDHKPIVFKRDVEQMIRWIDGLLAVSNRPDRYASDEQRAAAQVMFRAAREKYEAILAAADRASGDDGGRPTTDSAPSAASSVFDVREFGAAGDGTGNDTVAIQRAIDAASDAGGGRVLLPAGRYLSGTLFLKDNVTLHIAEGATLLGSTDLADYPQTWPAFKSYTDNYVCQALIYGERLHNVSITGRGTIDGQGGHAAFDRKATRSEKHPYGLRPYLIRLVECQHVRVSGLSLRDSPMWTQHYLACDDVVLDGLDVYGHANANNDFLDIDCCHNVRVSNCIGDTLDDGITLKSTAGRASKNIAITNCVVSSRCNGIKAGTESNGGFENITISNCVVRPTKHRGPKGKVYTGLAGIALEMVDGGVMDRLTVSNIAIEGVRVPIFARLGNRARPFTKDGPKPGMGRMRNVIIDNVVAAVDGDVGCAIAGLPGHPIENLSLSNLRLTFPGGGKGDLVERDVPEKPASYPECAMFGPLPAYGLYCRHVHGLTLRNVDVRWAERDERPALVCDDVRNLRIDGFTGTCVTDGTPLMMFRDVQDALVRGCVAPPGVSAFLDVRSPASGISMIGNDLSGARSPLALGDGVLPDTVFVTANRGVE
jgi:hypothetical protein